MNRLVNYYNLSIRSLSLFSYTIHYPPSEGQPQPPLVILLSLIYNTFFSPAFPQSSSSDAYKNVHFACHHRSPRVVGSCVSIDTSPQIHYLICRYSRADPNPNSPGPGDIYNTGAQCPIGWAVDPTGVWKTMNIQLMTGDNLHMIPLTSAFGYVIPFNLVLKLPLLAVATVDGTSSTANTFSWTCPEVS